MSKADLTSDKVDPQPTGAWAPSRRIFQDEVLRRRFIEEGFVKVRLLDADQAEALYRAFLLLKGERTVFSAVVSKSLPVHHTQLSEDRDYRAAAAALVRDVVEGRVKELLSHYRVVAAGIVLKAPHGQPTPLHSDWTLTRDPDDVTVTIWCPLIDVNEGNGGLQVVPGSHRLVKQITGPKIRDHHLPFQQALMKHAVAIPLAAGEALIFDYTMLHSAFANASATERPAFMLSCVPEDAAAVYYQPSPDGDERTLELRSWPADGYVGPEVEKSRTSDIETVPNINHAVGYEEYMRLLSRRKPLQTPASGGGFRSKVAKFFRGARS